MHASTLLPALLLCAGCLVGVDSRKGSPNVPTLVEAVLVAPQPGADGTAWAREGTEVVVDVVTLAPLDLAASDLRLDLTPLACAPSEARASAYRCTATLQRGAGNGPKALAGRMALPSGTTASLSSPVLVVADFQPPTAACLLDPARANALDRITLTVTPSEPLAAPPVASVDQPDLLVGTPTLVEGRYVYEVTATDERNVERYTLALMAQDRAGNAQEGDSLCTDAETRSGTRLARPPGLTAEPTIRADRSARVDGMLFVPLGAQVHVELPTSEGIDLERTRVSLSDLRLTHTGGDTWSGTVTDAIGDGVKDLEVLLVDVVGNRTAATRVGVVRLDTRPPSIVDAVLQRSPFLDTAVTGPGSVAVTDVDPLTGAPVRVTLTLLPSEPISGEATLLAITGALPPFVPGAAEAGIVQFVLEDVGRAAEGTTELAVTITDLAGNTANVDLGVTLTVDRTPPTDTVDVDTPGRAVLERRPWGVGDDGSGRLQAVRIAAGGAPPGALILLVDDDGGYVASGVADATGAVAELRSALDLPVMRLAVLDPAGNRGPAVRVRDVRWTAALGRKRVGSASENPHAVVALTRLDADRGDGRGVERDPADWVEATGGPRWRPVADPTRPSARREAAMVYDPVRGQTVLWGGDDGTLDVFGRNLDDTWVFDGDTWARVEVRGARPPARAGGAVAWDPARQEVLLFGGEGLGGTVLDDLWSFDGSRWERLWPEGPRPAGRSEAAMATDRVKGEVVLFGGDDASTLVGSLYDDTWIWDGAAWRREATQGTRPSKREGHMMASDPDGGVVLYGGASDGTRLDDTWRWSSGAWTRVVAASPPGPLAFAALAFDPALGRAVLFDGDRDAPRTWAWRGGTWQALDPGPTQRFPRHLGWDPVAREILVVGEGSFFDNLLFDDLWALGGDGTWTPRPTHASRPSPRDSAMMGTDRVTGEVVLFGGSSADGGWLGDTWVWDGAGWEEQAAAGAPSPRGGGRMAWDPVQQALLLFGGRDTTGRFDETWLWAGGVWELLSPVDPSPSGRTRPAMGTSSSTGEIVLFGGYDGVARDDTWRWNGQRWTLSPVNGLPPEAMHYASMAWDAGGARLLLFGGFYGRGFDAVSDDAFWWKQGLWSPLSESPHPPGRYDHVLAEDPEAGVVVLFGGDGLSALDDLWIHRRGRWAEVPVAAPWPAPRRGATLTHAPGAGMLLHGGYSTRDPFGDTWLLDLGVDARPGVRLDVDVTAAELRGAALQGIEIRWTAGAVGYPGAMEESGVDLAVWDVDHWRPIASGTAGDTAPAPLCWRVVREAAAGSGCAVEVDADLLDRLVVGAERARIHAVLSPTAPNGTGEQAGWRLGGAVHGLDPAVEVTARLPAE